MATAELGSLGPKESDPQFINWSIWWSLSRSLPWLMLLVLLAARPNRHLAAWAVLLPLIAVWMISLILNQILPFPVSFLFFIRQSVLVLALALTGLWLLSPWLTAGSRLVTFGSMVVVAGALAAVFPLFDSGINLDRDVTATMIITVLAATAMVLGLIVNAFWCRRRPGDRSFLLWLLLWTWGASFLLFYAAAIILSTTLFHYPVYLEREVLIFCLVAGLVAYLVLLPFVALALRSEFYRRRLYNCMRLSWLAKIEEPPPAETVPEYDSEGP